MMKHLLSNRGLRIVFGLIVIVVWLTLSAIPLYCALNFTCDADAGSFWSLFLSAVTVPAILYELYRLRSTIIESNWLPNIDLGIALAPISQDTLMSMEKLATRADWGLGDVINGLAILDKWTGNFDFNVLPVQTRAGFVPLRLIVRNKGKKAACRTKLRVKLIAFPGEEIPFIKFTDKKFSPQSDKTTFVYRAGSEDLIYPQDSELFEFLLFQIPWFESDGSHDLEGISKDLLHLLPICGTYKLVCTLWSEGLEKPVTTTLSVTISDATLRTKIEALEKRFLFSRFEDLPIDAT